MQKQTAPQFESSTWLLPQANSPGTIGARWAADCRPYPVLIALDIVFQRVGDEPFVAISHD
ncbi:hypothetical protein [uncultured Bradyrhizobium sp.]|uniref:hypothetical protein n=1 Tax=Bradyrhizobium sp. TaxID=376 RepID=UPI0026167B13|nr:hypothetical protein [uncultured Bradyrhizobium sp.]